MGGIVYFLLGWLIFGILMADSMEAGMTESMKAVYRGQDNYIMWGFVVGNLAYGLFLAIALEKFGTRTFMKGALAGLWIGALVAIAYDFMMYAQMTFLELDMIFMDVIMSAIFIAIIGGVVGFMLGRGKPKTA
ncbi:MAG: hypothetical protein ACKVPJ_03840 [Chitinophagales bacterium]